jgi:hypothetical protein
MQIFYRSKKWVSIIALAMMLLLVSSAFLGGMALAKEGEGKKNGPKVKMAVTGSGSPFVEGKVSKFAMEDGISVYLRSKEIFGILRAEAALLEVYGDDAAKTHAQKILDNIKSKFFADIWINYSSNETTGLTNVTIRVGSKEVSIIFPSPEPTDIPAIEGWARFIYDTARQMYDQQQND